MTKTKGSRWAFPKTPLLIPALLAASLVGLCIGYIGRTLWRKAFPAPPIVWCEGSGTGCIAAIAPKHTVTVLLFTARWCTDACGKFERDVLSDPAVRDRMARYGAIKLDADRDIMLATAYGVRKFPTLVFIDRRGHKIGLTSGVRDPYALLGWLDVIDMR